MHDGCNCCFSFWAIFCPFTSLTAQKMKIPKKWKKFLEISSLYMCVPKIMIRWCYSSWDMVRDERMDRRTDRQKKWNLEVGAPSKKDMLYVSLTKNHLKEKQCSVFKKKSVFKGKIICKVLPFSKSIIP